MKKRIAGISLHQWHKQSSSRSRLLLHVVIVRVHHPNNLNVVGRTIFRRNGVTHVLTDRVLIWEKFLRHQFVDKADAASVFLFTLGPGEIRSEERRVGK